MVPRASLVMHIRKKKSSRKKILSYIIAFSYLGLGNVTQPSGSSAPPGPTS